ncbi:MAG: transglycosylase SLT domain-containing protein [Pseudomonadota bacterium]
MFENSTLASLTSNAPKSVVQAIQTASYKTGVDFAYMVQQAAAESSFNPAAKARTSSATGLYQFIESTWMHMMDKHGAKYGIDTSQSRSELLALRKDPELASLMAGEFARENKEFLETHVGGDIGPTEMYFAHFLGASGAAGFLKAMQNDPQTIGAYIFPKESAANRGVFYDSKTGQPRTLEQIYAFFDKKFSVKSTPTDSANTRSEPDPQVFAANTQSQSKRTYVHIPPSLQQPISSLYQQRPMDAVQALLAFPSGNQGFASDSHVPGIFASHLYSNFAMSSVDFLSLYKTDTNV